MAAISRDKVLALLLVSVVFLPLAGCGGLEGLMDDDDDNGNGSPPGTLTLTADETNLAEGQSTTLRWSSTNASEVASSNFGATDVNGTAVVSPATTTTYEMTVRCNGGTITERVCVTVTGGGGEPAQYLFDDLWGSEGSEPGQGDGWGPADVALDADANVYVVDTGGPCIQKFTSEGEFLTRWGSFGSGPGQFSFASGYTQPGRVAVDDLRTVYVAEYVVAEGEGNGRIQKFDSEGQFLSQWAGEATPGGFWCPRDVAVDGSGNVYVADDWNQCIQKFTTEGQLLTQWGGPGSVPDLWWPVALDVGADGNVYVVTEGVSQGANVQPPGVLKFTSGGQLLTQWGLEFFQPDVTVDAAGNVYVSDQEGHCIHKLSSEGQLLTQLTFAGTSDPGAPGQISFPTGVAVDADGNLYVAETGFGGNWIIKFGPVTP